MVQDENHVETHCNASLQYTDKPQRTAVETDNYPSLPCPDQRKVGEVTLC